MREQGRELRLAELLHEELAGIIQFDMRDPRIGLVSVNGVRVTKDLAFADVYVSTLGADGAEAPSAEQKDALITVLNGASGFFRSALAKRHRMRGTPKPRFHYDESVARGRRMEKLIDQARAADRRSPTHPRSGGAVEPPAPANEPLLQHGR